MSVERQKKGSTGIVVTLLVMLPLLYVLSIGPVARIYRGRTAPEAALRFYEPLIWTCVQFRWSADALDAYLRLWH